MGCCLIQSSEYGVNYKELFNTPSFDEKNSLRRLLLLYYLIFYFVIVLIVCYLSYTISEETLKSTIFNTFRKGKCFKYFRFFISFNVGD